MDRLKPLFDAVIPADLVALWMPHAWVAWASKLPWLLAASCFAVGLFVFWFGSIRFVFRFVQAALLVALLYLLGPSLAEIWPFLAGVLDEPIYLASIAFLAVLVAPLGIFAFFAYIGGTLSAHLMHTDPNYYGFLPGAVILGSVALFFRNGTSVIVSRLLAWSMMGMGLVRFACAFRWGESFVRSYPTLITVLCLGLGLIGAASKLASKDT